ncbi:hypothetical protein [Lactiplantibacillus paraxiangfangensis]|uniref:hypothetical protein n=1 Tax=Lactiplantibacillus paraxiangfangensis TaxID=3076224 RepID=UPI0030C6D410
MRKYTVQLTGHDFEPAETWQLDPTAAVATVQSSADYDLLVWDPDDETCEIYPQETLAALSDRLAHTAYSRLLDQIAQVVSQQGVQIIPGLRRQWYLVGDLAVLEHTSLINVAAALLSLTVQALKTETASYHSSAVRLRGLADQARCWLMAAQVTSLQLVASPKPLTTLLQYLLDQANALDACHAGGRSRAWQLANDAEALSKEAVHPTQFQTNSAWTLIRAAALEHYDQ